MKIQQISSQHEFYENVVDLRYQLFFKDFALSKDIVFDELETSSKHFILTLNDNLVAYGRLSKLDSTDYKISQVVVKPELQRQGFGKELLGYIINTAIETGAKSLQLNSQKFATRFYENFGFMKVGNTYNSKTTGLPHVKMVMNIPT